MGRWRGVASGFYARPAGKRRGTRAGGDWEEYFGNCGSGGTWRAASHSAGTRGEGGGGKGEGTAGEWGMGGGARGAGWTRFEKERRRTESVRVCLEGMCACWGWGEKKGGGGGAASPAAAFFPRWLAVRGVIGPPARQREEGERRMLPRFKESECGRCRPRRLAVRERAADTESRPVRVQCAPPQAPRPPALPTPPPRPSAPSLMPSPSVRERAGRARGPDGRRDAAASLCRAWAGRSTACNSALAAGGSAAIRVHRVPGPDHGRGGPSRSESVTIRVRHDPSPSRSGSTL